MAETPEKKLSFQAAPGAGEVSALLVRPPRAERLYVLAHGAGAPMTHPFLAAVAHGLAARRIATFRYNFPYMESGKRRPDVPRVLEGTVRSAVAAANEAAGDLPFLAGGKSMGGRITSQAAAQAPLPNVRGIVFLGFPLHPPGKPATTRGDHLAGVSVPMLFLQGTRDNLADLDLLKEVLRPNRSATLHVVQGADHSFHVLKRSGRTDEQVLDELTDQTRKWAGGLR
ncbi:MAG TPA: alpha/beta family hydrolase [bacterium]|nr:alpha/beta family hydrolase [bacterium]